MLNVYKISLISFIFLSTLSFAQVSDLRSKYIEQQIPKNEEINPKFEEVKKDITKTWKHILQHGELFYIMTDSRRNLRPGGGYERYLSNIFIVNLVEDKLFMPMRKNSNQSNPFFWKEQSVHCDMSMERKSGTYGRHEFYRPIFLSEEDSLGFHKFKATFHDRLGDMPPHKSGNTFFEVNFKDNQCFYSKDGNQVKKCHVASHDSLIRRTYLEVDRRHREYEKETFEKRLFIHERYKYCDIK
jgi:hypothetical protein